MRDAVALACVPLLLALAEPRARAADPAAAQALFDEGKRLVSLGRYAEACAKLAESDRLDHGVGTLFHLADCDEKIGRVAVAWTMFLQVASEAKVLGEGARAAGARERAAALEPKLAHLTIDPGPERRSPGLQILRDGVLVGEPQWGVSVPVDPGPHEVAVNEPAKAPWHARMELAPGATTVVLVPLLPEAPIETHVASASRTGVATTTAAEVPTGSRRGNAQRAAGIVTGVLGLAGLGVGAYFGAVSLRDHDDAAPHCGPNGCDPTGVSLRDDARQSGTAATIALAAGGGVFAAGLLTFATAPRSTSSGTTVAIGPGVVLVQGGF
jgi:hypothetical protein